MGKLGAALQALPKTKKGPRCSVGVFLGTLAKGDAEELRTALKDATVMSSALAIAVRSTFGSDLSQHTIARHRRGHCSCQN